MKGKKSAFFNTSTGSGKAKYTHNHKHHSNKNSSKQEKTADKTYNDKVACTEQNDEDLNSGFGDYLRSPEAIEMMKLFVFANSIMLILTMAWPNIKETYYMFMAWWSQYN